MRRDPVLLATCAVAALLLFWNLDGRQLWQDEAETALLGRSILANGIPIASDGRNIVSQEAGREFDADFVWRWSPWVQFYLAAAGEALGSHPWQVRLPFALIGWVAVPLTAAAAMRATSSLLVARVAALALTLSPWFLLHARQARWHAPAYALVALLLLAFFSLERNRRWAVAVAAGGAALFYTNYFVAICAMGGLAAALPLLKRDTWLRGFGAIVACGLLSIPGAVFFRIFTRSGADVPYGEHLFVYGQQLFAFVLPLPVALLLVRERRRPILFLGAAIVAAITLMAAAPWTMFRYLSVVFPAAAILLAAAVEPVFRWHRAAGMAMLSIVLLTGFLNRVPFGAPMADERFVNAPLAGFLREIADPATDTEDLLVEHLANNARIHDAVLTTYGDLPLQLRTPLLITGGLQGARLPRDPEWIVVRGAILSTEPGKDSTVLEHLERNVPLNRYHLVAVLPDGMLAANPDPTFHIFGSAPSAMTARIFRRDGS